jgi:transposase
MPLALHSLVLFSSPDSSSSWINSAGQRQGWAHFGLTPKKYQSAETDITGRISKIGDKGVRTALYEAGHIILTQPLKGCTALKSWAMRLAKRAGMKKAKVALARKLAVIMHRMLVDGTLFASAAVAA